MDTREKILNASIDLFSQKGYTETSIKEIAQQSGIMPSSIYNHFSSKISILSCILDMYMEHTKQRTLDRATIDKKVETEEPRDILMGMFYRYSPDEVDKYTKILKIILHEQYRNEQVGNFFKEYFIKEIESYIDYTIEKLIEKKRIKPVNHRYYAKILNDLCLASSIQYGHLVDTEEYRDKSRIAMDDTLAFVIDMLLSGDRTVKCTGKPNHLRPA